jgi:hypothetical protein
MKLLSSNIVFIGLCVVLFLLAFLVTNSFLWPKCGYECYQLGRIQLTQAPIIPVTHSTFLINQTTSDWIITWYKWMLAQNPSATFDQTGNLTMKYQPVNSPVYFLAEEHNSIAQNRHIVMTHGKTILFPAVTALVLSYDTHADLAKFSRGVDTVIASQQPHTAYAFLDNKPISTTFIKTPIFRIHTYAHNAALGNYHDGDALAITAGYWVFLRPLSVGDHTISLYGGTPGYVAGATYHVKVI